MKVAQAFKRADGFYFGSSSQTTVGVWIGSPPELKLEVNATAAAIGDAVIQVIHASKSPVPHPSNWDDLPNPMLDLAGVKSWRAFEKGAKCCSLEMENEELRLIPHRRLGPNRGFEPILNATVEVSSHSTPEQIGAAIATAFLACEQ
jgi:hypothetical protein